MNDSTELGIHGSRLIDACAVDGPAMQPALGYSNDSNFFIVDEIDSLEPQKTIVHPSDSASELLGLELGCTNPHDDTVILVPSPSPSPPLHPPSSTLLGTSAPASWNSFPTIPEHAELHVQTLQQYRTPRFGTGSHSPASSDQDDVPHGVPRVASMPNLHFLSSNSPAMAIPQEETSVTLNMMAMAHTAGETTGALADQGTFLASSLSTAPVSLGPHRHSLRSRAAMAAATHRMSRSRSANDVADLARYSVPHSEFLTPPHLRKGKGGRQPAIDPRLDPRIDPKKAKRILANRLSAAKSKLKQKSAVEAMRQRVEMLRLQGASLRSEVDSLSSACSAKESEQRMLQQELRAVEERLIRGLMLSGNGSGSGNGGVPVTSLQLGLVA